METQVEQSVFENLAAELQRDGIQKTVVGALIERDGKVLLLWRARGEFMEGLVELPSGNVEQGEDLLTALAREVEEETGLTTDSVDRYLGKFDYTSGSGKKARQLNFLVRASGSLRLNPAEHANATWIDPKTAEFQELNISSETRAIIKSL